MACKRTFERGVLLRVLLLSLAGFSGLGDGARSDGFQPLHVATRIAWLGRLTAQRWVIRQRRAQRHRTIGTAV